MTTAYDRNQARALGTGSMVTLRGKTWSLSPITAKDFTEASAFLRRKNKSVFAELMEDEAFHALAPALQEVALKEKMQERREQEDIFSTKTLENWLDGEGLLYLFYRHVRKQHKEIQTFEQLRDMFDPDNDELQLSMPEMAQLKDKMDEANGLQDDTKKNLQTQSSVIKKERAAAKKKRVVKKNARKRN